jgi:hypothetical protein
MLDYTVNPQNNANGENPDRLIESAIPLCIWVISGMVVLLAVEFSLVAIPACRLHPDSWTRTADVASAMAAWDGQWQIDIMQKGYLRRINRQDLNPAVFPPVYPLLARWLSQLGIRDEAALLLFSNGAFLVLLITFFNYARDRGFSLALSSLAVAIISFSPYSHFFRMAYSESLLCALVSLYFFGTSRGWHPLALAIIVGVASATRVVGVVLLPLLLWDVWIRFPPSTRWMKTGCAGLLGASGMLLFMNHLHDVQGDSLAFIKGQVGWTIREENSLAERIVHAASGIALIDAYRSDCVCYWGRKEPSQLPMFNMQFINPLMLLGAGCLMFVGWKKRILTVRELFYCILVVGIPYFTQGYRICLHSQSRYVLAAFPLTLVLASIFERSPTWIFSQLSAVMLVLFFGNTALFVAWYFSY